MVLLNFIRNLFVSLHIDEDRSIPSCMLKKRLCKAG